MLTMEALEDGKRTAVGPACRLQSGFAWMPHPDSQDIAPLVRGVTEGRYLTGFGWSEFEALGYIQDEKGDRILLDTGGPGVPWSLVITSDDHIELKDTYYKALDDFLDHRNLEAVMKGAHDGCF